MRLLFLVLICAISCGCRDAEKPSTDEPAAARPRAAVKLTVLVVDDAELAKGISLLAGEWSERSGGELAVSEMPLAELLAAEKIYADLVIYPSRHLGTLAMRGWLRPVRQSVFDDPALAWGDFLTTLRDQTLRFGAEVLALPLGEMPLVLAWSGDVPENLPTTWEQLEGQVARGEKPKAQQFSLTAEFLARALAKTSPGDRAGLLFDSQTLDAQLTLPHLVRAVEELAEAVTEASLAVSVVLPRSSEATRLSPLLGSDEVYNGGLERWEPVEDAQPPVICGFSGRLVSVTSASRNAASAFKLLPWLTNGSTGTQLSQRSQATLWCRASQVAQAEKWLGEKSDDDRARWLTEMLSRGDAYLLPRIPGIDDYLAELETAMSEAIGGEQSAIEALNGVEVRWNAITEKLGREQQRIAFQRHLGLLEH